MNRNHQAIFCQPDLSGRPFKLTTQRVMSLSASVIYKAWTEQFDRWFAVPGTMLMTPQVNAPFFFETGIRIETKKPERHPHYGRFLQLEQNQLVQLTWITGAEGTRGAETVVTVSLEPQGEGTRLTLDHAGFPDEASRDQHAKAWPMVLEHFEKTLATKKA